MRAWSRVEPERYRRLELRAHALLAEIPLHDAWQVELPGGGAGRTLEDVRALLGTDRLTSLNAAVRALFGLRRLLGRLFGWDSAKRTPAVGSFVHRLSEDDRRRSLVAPGAADGPFTVLYVHPCESVSEVRNATVHAFSAFALEPHAAGYRLYWAIYVAPVGRITAFYMALIDPFRRWIIYPAILRHVHRSWCAGQVRAAV